MPLKQFRFALSRPARNAVGSGKVENASGDPSM
jgi:hypothetical protein